MKLIKNRPSKEVAKYLLLAQINSDVSKDIKLHFYNQKNVIKFVGFENLKKAYCLNHYEMKSFYIDKAITYIQRNNTGYKFSVGVDDYGNNVIYFQWKIDEETYQMSFHYPSEFACSSSKLRMKWDHKSSREAVIELAKYMMAKN